MPWYAPAVLVDVAGRPVTYCKVTSVGESPRTSALTQGGRVATMTPSAIAIPARILLSRRPRVSRARDGRGGASRVVSVRAAAGNRLRGKKEYVPTDRVASLQNEGAYAVLAAANALEAKGKDALRDLYRQLGGGGMPFQHGQAISKILGMPLRDIDTKLRESLAESP